MVKMSTCTCSIHLISSFCCVKQLKCHCSHSQSNKGFFKHDYTAFKLKLLFSFYSAHDLKFKMFK